MTSTYVTKAISGNDIDHGNTVVYGPKRAEILERATGTPAAPEDMNSRFPGDNALIHGSLHGDGTFLAHSLGFNTFVKVQGFATSKSYLTTPSVVNNKITIDVAGRYQVQFNANFQATVSKQYLWAVRVDDTDLCFNWVTIGSVAGAANVVSGMGQFDLSVGDVLELYLYQAEGGTLSVTPGTVDLTAVCIKRG